MAYKYQKQVMKQKYGSFCMLCGCKKKMEELTFHHIKPRSLGGKDTIENGANLCRNCHDLIHKHDFFSIEYFDLTMQILNFKINKFDKVKYKC